jgi:predicted HTH domain antitoxin
MSGITISLPEDIVRSVRIPPDEIEDELRKELAVALYVRQVLSFGKARKLADLTVWQFHKLLAKHKIARNYGEEELKEDLAYADGDS